MAQARLAQRGKLLPKSIIDKFSYTGRMRYEIRMMDGKLYHVLIFETSGTLTVTGEFIGDVWLVGAGGCGTADTSYGRGAGSGYTTNSFARGIISGAIVIGAGATTETGQGGTTSFDGLTALGGYSGEHATNPGNGGSGAGGGGYNRLPGIGQHTTTRPFVSADMPPHAGGGAGYNGSDTEGNGGSDGSDGHGYSESGYNNGLGGLYGGGNSGNSYVAPPSAMVYGSGSGAAASVPAPGTPGAVMIRILA